MGAIGYVFAGVGLAIVILSNQIFTYLSKIFTLKLPFVIIAGIALILIGIFFLMGNSSSGQTVKHAAEEVPIYEGEGKNKRIVGYKKAPTK